MTKEFTSSSYLQTQQTGEEFGRSLKGGSVVCLCGQLGAGKTTFTQGIAAGLGIKKRIISPTFVLVREHRITNHELRIKKLYHVDLYRVKNDKDMESLGLDEILQDKNSITVIEWAEKLGSKLPKERIDIYFENIDDSKRKIRIMNYE